MGDLRKKIKERGLRNSLNVTDFSSLLPSGYRNPIVSSEKTTLQLESD